MDNETYNAPDHYKTAAKLLKPVVQKIQNAFITRPSFFVSAGSDFYFPSPEMDSQIVEAITGLAGAVENFSSFVLAMKYVDERTVARHIAEMSASVDALIACLISIGAQSFPRGYEAGQPLLFAILEKPLQQYLFIVEELIFAIENPELAVLKYGKPQIEFELPFDFKPEVEAYDSWLNNYSGYMPAPMQPNKSRQSGPGLLGLLLAFFIGYEIGKD